MRETALQQNYFAMEGELINVVISTSNYRKLGLINEFVCRSSVSVPQFLPPLLHTSIRNMGV